MLAYLLALLMTFFSSVIHPSHQVLATQVHTSITVTSLPPISPTPLPTFSPTPTRFIQQTIIDCIGPDNKHFQTTQQLCLSFNTAWHHQSISFSPTSAAEKIGEHTYTMQFIPDRTMASAKEIFQALNLYRQNHSVGTLVWNPTLTTYAQSRTDFYASIGKLDEHAGFMDYVNNHDGFSQLGFNKLGENAALAGPLSGTHLIEKVYAGDPEHNANQLNIAWTDVGIGVHGFYSDIIFGGMKR